MRHAKALSTVLAISLLPLASVAADNVATLIRKQSQAFSDASASGDAAVLGRYLDDNVVFMNESGELATKKDIVDGASPPAAGTNNTLVQTDFAIKIHGKVAVTSFTDVSTVHFHGQELHAKYRSTEVWQQQGDAWRMISSQTIALQDDPPAVKLPASLLDQYVGTYQAGPDFRFVIARQGDELTGASNGQKPFVIKAELADVLFTPGQPRTRRIFQRDATGRITGFVSRREGHDLILKRV